MIYCQLRLSSQAIKLLVKTQGAIPISYMQALNDNLRQANEIEHLQKITKDYSLVKKLIDENEMVKKLASDKDQQIRNLAKEKEEEITKLAKEKDEEIANLKTALSQLLLSNKMGVSRPKQI